jgi:hypothetical protein
MRLRTAHAESTGRFSSTNAMRDELSHALVEALFELDVLPRDEDAALVGLYAVMDDLEAAIRKTQKLDRALARSA